MEDKKAYEIVNGFWDRGVWRAKGSAPLPMTEREARAHVIAGDLKLVPEKAVSKPVQTPSATASETVTATAEAKKGGK